MSVNNYIPAGSFKIDPRIPDTLPNYTQAVFTPKNTAPIPEFKQEMASASEEFYDEPDYTEEIAQGINDILNERPQLSRSEAEEQMHLVELRRLAEAYTENDARVLSEVLAKKYPMIMFAALSNEFDQIKGTLDTITGAINTDEQ